MVAVITGQNLGLGFGKVNNLNGQGLGRPQVGQNGQKVYVNAADGNLVIQNQDAVLIDNGLDLGVLRTYNSQGQFSDDNGANWMTGVAAKSVALSGSLGTDGSSVTRTDEDGSQSTYSWNSAAQEYLNGQGGNNSNITVVNGQLVWANGAGSRETYDAGSGRLLSMADPDGHQVVYSYNSDGTLASAVSDSGDGVFYDYANGQLTDIRTKTQDAAGNWQTQTAVYYSYDSQGRLQTVTVDLSPSDNSITDGNVYTTTYTYDGTSNRIAGITQSDGTSLSFTYVQVGSEYRVATVTNGLQQTTSFTYNTTQLQTTIQDPQSATTVLQFDPNSRLTQINQPGPGSTTASTRFQYDSAGNLTTVTDPSGNSTVYGYDSDGNQTSSVDAAGDTVTSTYNADNQLTSRTVYLAPATGTTAAGQPETTRYYYGPGTPGLLRYVISADGGITEYLYNAQDQRASTLVYTAQTLNAGVLTGNETTAQIAALVAAATPAADNGATTRTDVQRTDTTYDPHGQVSSVTTYTAVSNDADLTGIAADGATTTYVYDQAGQLLSKVDPTGAQVSYSYDGLGRVTAVVDSQNGTTTTQYDSADNAIVVTTGGSSTTSVYDAAGNLVSVTDPAGTAQNYYDADGRVIMSRDVDGELTWTFYDAAGNTIGSVDNDGDLTEYVLGAAGKLTETIDYSTPLDTSLLVDDDGNPTGVSLAAIRPAATADDETSWQVNDSTGRPIYTIAANGAVTQTVYDGASQVVETIAYANPINTGALGSAPSAQDITQLLSPSAGADQVTRNFYDSDGDLLGTLDPTGHVTQYFYNSAAALTETRVYAQTAKPALWASGTLAQLTNGLQSIDDSRTLVTYDATGKVLNTQVVQGYPDDNMPGVTDIQGTLLQPGQSNTYQFTLNSPSKFFFDGIDGSQIQWQLQENGQPVLYSQDLTAVNNPFEELGSGTYQLTVGSNQGATGNYDFRILGDSAAAQLTTNTVTSGQLAPGTQAALYAFTASQGDQLLLQPTGGRGDWTWSLFGPNGLPVLSLNSANAPLFPFAAPATGTYYLSIEGEPDSNGDPATSDPYSFTLFQSTPTTTPISLGQSVQANFTPGSVSNYTVNVTQAGWLKFDTLSSFPGYWYLTNASGQTVDSGNTDTDQADAYPVAVKPGSYSLQVQNQGGATSGSLDFQLLDTAATSVTTIQSGQSIALQSSSGVSGAVYQLNVATAANLNLAAGISGGDTVTWQVTNANGTSIGSGTLGNGSLHQLALPQGGEYFLWLGGNLSNTAPLQGSLQVTTWTNQVINAGQLSPSAMTDLPGSTTAAGQTITTNFNVAQSGTWLFRIPTALAGARWTLTGPTGTVISSDTLSDTQAQGGAAAYLTAGAYQLAVIGGTATGAFDIQATPFALSTALTSAAPTVLPALTVGGSVFYRIDATPGDSFAVTLADTDGAPNGEEFSVEAFDAYGDELYSGTSSTLQFSQSQAAGPVYLLITQTAAQSAGATLTAVRTPATQQQVTSTPITVNQEVSAAGASGPATPLYDLNLPQDDLVFVQSSSTNYNYVTLNGPLASRSTSLPASSPQGVPAPSALGWVPAGDYQLQFYYGQNDFPFTVYTGSSGTNIAPAQDVDSTLAAGQSVEIFKVSAQAGQLYRLDGLANTASGLGYAVYDAYGNQLAAGDPSTPSGQSWGVSQDETCYVVVYRDPNAASQAATANFSIAAAPAPQPLTAGVWLNQAGDQEYDYSVTITQPTTFFMDSDSGSSVSTAVYSNGSLVAGTGQTSWALQPGSYIFAVTLNQQSSGNVRLTSSTDVSPLTIGASQSVQLDANGASSYYSVNLAAGETFTWTPGTGGTTDADGGYSIYDANGNDVYDGDINSAGSFAAQTSGTYILQLYDPAATATTANFSVTLTRVGAPASQPLTTGVWLNQAGDQEYDYSVTITRPTTFFMDSDTDAWVNTTVYDSDGSLVADTGQYSWALQPGSYIFAVTLNQEVSANIRLTSSADVSPLSTGAEQLVQLAPDWAGSYYSVNLTAGETFTWTPGTGGTTDADGGYSVYDANGNDVYDGDINSPGSFVAQASGTYIVQLYDGADSATTADFTVTLTQPAPPPALSTTQPNTVTVPTTQGSLQSTQFSVAQSGWWVLNGGQNYDFEEQSPTWSVDNTATNTSVVQGTYYFMPQAVYLTAGTYDISLTNYDSGPSGGDQPFTLTSLTPTVATAGQPFNIGSVSNDQPVVFEVNAGPLSQVTLAFGGGQFFGRVQVYDQYGNSLGNPATYTQDFASGPLIFLLTGSGTSSNLTVTPTITVPPVTISPLTTDTSQSVQVAANDAPTYYSVDLNAGDELTWTPGAASTTGSYSLYTLTGTQVFTGDINQLGAFTAQSAGTYFLAISNAAANAATVNFTAERASRSAAGDAADV